MWFKRQVVPTFKQVEGFQPDRPKLIELDVTLKRVVFPYLDRAMQITGAFEGEGFGQVTGDFDGQGISVGILQWNYGQGSLQSTILKPFIQRHGSIDDLGIFPGPVDVTATMSGLQARAYCRSRMLRGTALRPEWLKAWRKFMTSKEVVELQKIGCHGVAQRAETLCFTYGELTEKSFCFFFDVVTQNGSMKGLHKPAPSRDVARSYAALADRRNRAIWTEALKSADEESLILFLLARHRSQLSNPRWALDVFQRKGTIALGKGFVHGREWNLFPAPINLPSA